MVYKKIDFHRAQDIENIMLNTALCRSINISISRMNLSFKANEVTETAPSANMGEYMNEFYLYSDGEDYPLCVGKKKYSTFLNINNRADINHIHIFLGTNPARFNSKYFSQIELSDGLEDRDYIYIVKNISKLAGEGSIARLNKGLDSKDAKIARRITLKKEFGNPTIQYNNNEWLILCRIKKFDLIDAKKHENILYDILGNFLKYAFLIEDIISR